MKLNLVSERQKSRVQVITHAYWAIAQVFEEEREATVSAIKLAHKSGEPLTVQERLTARLCALDDLAEVFKGHLPKTDQERGRT